MAISIGSLQVIYSGGAANVDPNASLGGAISTAAAKRVQSQDTTVPVNVTGVTIIDAFGNALGVGTLSWNSATDQLLWQPNGAVEANGLTITTDGLYSIGTSNGYLFVQVVAASLPGSSVQDSIVVSAAVNESFDNITANQSLSGYTDYRCFYLLNTHATDTAQDVRLFIKKQPDGDDTLAIALDPSGLNGTALGPLADEEDSTEILNALVFAAPLTSSAGLLLGNLLAGEFRPFWVRRVVPPETTVQVVNNRSALGISAFL